MAFPKMGYCVSVEGNVVHVCEVSDGKWPRCLSCLMFMPSGTVELFLVLFEMANCTCVVVSRFSLWEESWLYGLCFVDFVCAVWSDVCELCIESLCFVYVSDGLFSSDANVSVLLCRWFLLDSFAMVPHRKWGSGDRKKDQFCHNIVSRCLFCVHVLVCLFYC